MTDAPAATPSPPAAPPRRPGPILRGLRLALRGVGWLLGTALVMLVLLLGLVLGTQTGLRTVVGLMQDLAPGMLSVGRIDGRLLGRIALDDLQLRLPGFELDLREGVLDWSPLGLLTGDLEVAELTARDLRIATAPSAEKKPLELPEIHLPVGVDLQQGLVEGLRYETIGAPPESAIVVDRLALSATARADGVAVRTLDARLSQPAVVASARGDARLTGAWPVTFDLNWSFTLPPGPDPAVSPATLTGTGSVRGDLDALQIEHRVAGPVEATLTATLHNVLNDLGWDGRIAVTRVDLPALAPGAPVLDLHADLATNGNLNRATLTGTLGASAPGLADLGRLDAALDLGWADQTLTIHRLGLRETPTSGDAGAHLDLTGQVALADPANPGIILNGDWAGLRWPLTGAPVATLDAGQLAVDGTLAGAEVTLTTTLRGPALPETGLALKARAGRERIDIAGLDLTTLGGRATLTGQVTLAPALAWDLSLKAADLDPGRQYPGLDGRISLTATSQGNLTDGFGYQLQTGAALRGYPPARLTASGSGTASAVAVDSLRLDALNGRIDGNARLTLAPALAWEANLTAANLDPGTLQRDWPGRIGGRLETRGSLGPDGPDLTARLDGLGGQLRGYPVRVDGNLGLKGQTLTLERLAASSGTTRLTASGRAGAALDLRLDLDSPDLAALLPGARGALTANGRLTGTPAAPLLALRLDGRGLGLADQGIARLQGSIDAGLAPSAPLRVALTAEGIKAGGQQFERAVINADGSLARHRLAATLSGPTLNAEVEASGALDASNAWAGNLQRLRVAPKDLPALALERPVPITLAGEKIKTGPLCLGDGQGSAVCASFEQTAAGRFSTSLDARRIDLALLRPLLPPTLTASGFALVNARFTGNAGQLTGNARLELPEAALTLVLPGDDERLVLNGGRLDLDANAAGLTARLALPVEGIGRLGGELGLPGLRLGATATPALRGQVTARVDSFDRLAELVPDVTNLTGNLDADLRLGGTLARPTIGGNLALRGVGLRVPLTGTEVKDLNITATGRGGEGFDITGAGLVGGGRLEIDGSAGGLLGGNPTLAFTVRGDNLVVADSREYFARLSLDLNGQRGPGGVAITGQIKVPEARIMPRAVAAGAILPSPDVVIIGADTGGPPLPVTLDILTRLGDNVRIEAFGLRGRLTGDLRLLKQPGGDLVGSGQLAVNDGTFRVSLPGLGLVTAIGAPLRIEQGIINFAGTSLTNPGLVLKAVRQGGDLTAGVQVLGTLRSPKLAFFSDTDPNMSQAEITKYLVTGIPPRRDGDMADDRALSVGTYVAPKLFVEYENNLGGQSDRVKLRYDLNNRVELQTETGGGAQGGDIFFKFEN